MTGNAIMLLVFRLHVSAEMCMDSACCNADMLIRCVLWHAVHVHSGSMPSVHVIAVLQMQL